MVKGFDEIFDECVDRINRGGSIDECLASYPEHAKQLEPALRALFDVRAAYSFTPSQARKAEARQRFQTALAGLEQRRQQPRIGFPRILGWSRVWATAAAILIVAVAGYLSWRAAVPPTAYAGLLEVRITDAPAYDVSKAIISVKNIEVHRTNTEDDAWTVVITEEKTFDLVALSGMEQVLGSKTIEAAEYDGVRMEVVSAMVTIDGDEKAARVPSGRLKLLTSFKIERDSEVILTLDFDLHKSVVVTGMGKVNFKPVIKVLTRQAK